MTTRIGAFEVLGELGRGGAGVVYQARGADGRDVEHELTAWLAGGRPRRARSKEPLLAAAGGLVVVAVAATLTARRPGSPADAPAPVASVTTPVPPPPTEASPPSAIEPAIDPPIDPATTPARREAEDLCHQARTLLDERSLDAALDVLERAIAVDPTHATAWVGVGSVHYVANRLDAALQAFDRAVQLGPLDGPSEGLRATTLVRLRRFEEAVPILQRLLGEQTALRERYAYALGQALRGLRRDEEAIAPLEIAASARVDGWRARFQLAEALHTVGRLEEALEQYRRVPQHAVYPGGVTTNVRAIEVLLELERPADALAELERLPAVPADLEPRVVAARALVLAMAGDHRGALDRAVPVLDAEHAELAHAARSLALRGLGRDAEARAAIDAALARCPTHHLLRTLAEALQRP